MSSHKKETDLSFLDDLDQKIKLTKQQEEVVELFKEWLKSSTKEPFVLLGVAGTGKTFVARVLVELAVDILPIAPTHQSAGVLKNKIGCDVQTTAQSIGLSPNLDISNYDPSNPLFVKKKAGELAKYRFGLQDEASMVPDDVINIQLGISRMVYIGDPAQLPPVKQELPEVLLTPSYTLTEIVRTSDPTIINFCNMLREDDWGSQLKSFVRNLKNSNSIQVVKVKDYVNEGEKVLCYTNKCVDKWNNTLRKSNKLSDIDLYKFYDKVDEWNNSEEFMFKDIKEGELYYDARIYGTFVKVWKKEGFMEYGKQYKKLMKAGQDAYKPGRNRQPKEYYEAWGRFYDWRNENLIQEGFKYHGINIKKQFDYGYSFTIHKSQGSSIPVVAIDLGNIFGDQAQSLFYVASTRAQTKIILITS